MRRLLLIPLALLGLFSAGAFASIKQANSSAVARITSLTPTSITVGKKHHPHLTCSLTGFSPSTVSFAIGDRVKIACSNRVLVAIADMPGSSNAKKTDDVVDTSGISGKVSAIGPKFITVHDGDRTMTCTVGADSPSITPYAVGDHVKIGCVNGVLVTVGSPTSGPGVTTSAATTANVTNANGPITLLGTSSISVQTMTCTFGPSSPSLAGFHLGDSVRMYCLNGVLYELKHNDTPPPPPGPTTTTTTTTTTTQGTYTGISGTISALTDGSIAVHGSGDSDGPASLTCPIGLTSPSTAGFAVGNSVRMYCLNGVLYQLKHNDAPPPTTSTTTTTATTTTTRQNYTGVAGTITALSDGSITATSSGGDGPPR